mmetsp:Transcript_11385/g.27450  ORF Transcript_11385/g.27450 Transcript_11385/m.27450 type:complete len:103 (+) Transcript_11385:1234-1542(+)
MTLNLSAGEATICQKHTSSHILPPGATLTQDHPSRPSMTRNLPVPGEAFKFRSICRTFCFHREQHCAPCFSLIDDPAICRVKQHHILLHHREQLDSRTLAHR